MDNVKHCPLCRDECEVYRHATLSCTEYSCLNCGQYTIHDFFNPISTKMLSIMYYYILHKKRDSKKITYFVRDITKHTDNNAYYIDQKMLENMYPKTLNDKVDMVMLNLNTKIKFLGDEFALPNIYDDTPYDDIALLCNLFLVDDNNNSQVWHFGNQVKEMIRILREYEYIKKYRSQNSYTFTENGWNHVSELLSKNEEIHQAFIAMWFSDEMEAARGKIIKAIEDTGYFPVIIDAKEHNNQIVPEIFYEIQRSKFIIADLTGHRNGVYYEAGYAQALEKEVILTCKDTAFKKRHFDVAQKNTIRWVDEDDLYKRLLKRIEATVGKRNG